LSPLWNLSVFPCCRKSDVALPLERYVLQLPFSPLLAECLHVMLLPVAPGPPSAMMSSSLHHLQTVLLLLLSSNRSSSKVSISTCPSSNANFQVIESTTTIMHALFFKLLCMPILSSHVCRAWMQASPQLGCVSQGYTLATMTGCSSLFRRRQLQSRLTWVRLALYLMVSSTTRCCASARPLVLLFLGVTLQHPLYPTSLYNSMPRFWRRFAIKVQLTYNEIRAGQDASGLSAKTVTRSHISQALNQKQVYSSHKNPCILVRA